jgi:hypothetical protein
MAVFVSFDPPGIARERFGGVGSQILPKIKAQPGFVAHAGWLDESGGHIRETWESSQDHERWVRDVVAPVAQQQSPGTQLTDRAGGAVYGEDRYGG